MVIKLGRRADLLNHAMVHDDNAIGELRWLLYARGSDGWSDARPVALPSGYTVGAFASGREDTATCGGNVNRPAWARRDLDGDGVTEIVVTGACDDDAVGTSTWRVYRMACADG